MNADGEAAATDTAGESCGAKTPAVVRVLWRIERTLSAKSVGDAWRSETSEPRSPPRAKRSRVPGRCDTRWRRTHSRGEAVAAVGGAVGLEGGGGGAEELRLREGSDGGVGGGAVGAEGEEERGGGEADGGVAEGDERVHVGHACNRSSSSRASS